MHVCLCAKAMEAETRAETMMQADKNMRDPHCSHTFMKGAMTALVLMNKTPIDGNKQPRKKSTHTHTPTHGKRVRVDKERTRISEHNMAKSKSSLL